MSTPLQGPSSAPSGWLAKLRPFWNPPDRFLIDAGKQGELLIAQVRFALLVVLTFVSLANLAFAPPGQQEPHVGEFLASLVAIGVAGVVYVVVRRDRRQRWLPLATSLLDVTLVSAALAVVALLSDPLRAANSPALFDAYFLAIGATCLRYDRRVALVAGVTAMAEYLALITVVVFDLRPGAGSALGTANGFQWHDQVSRLVLLLVATTLAVYIVRGMQRQRELSTADPLTGIFNRRFFDDYFDHELLRADRYHVPVAVAMIDVDHFKRFNDVYGHAAGDRALRTVARALLRAVRRSDLVARYGGEEFVVVFRETQAEEALGRVEEIRQAVEAESLLVARATGPARITVSAGVASWPADGLTAEDLLGAADSRLFQAKDAGRNRVVGPPVAQDRSA